MWKALGAWLLLLPPKYAALLGTARSSRAQAREAPGWHQHQVLLPARLPLCLTAPDAWENCWWKLSLYQQGFSISHPDLQPLRSLLWGSGSSWLWTHRPGWREMRHSYNCPCPSQAGLSPEQRAGAGSSSCLLLWMMPDPSWTSLLEI